VKQHEFTNIARRAVPMQQQQQQQQSFLLRYRAERRIILW